MLPEKYTVGHLSSSRKGSPVSVILVICFYLKKVFKNLCIFLNCFSGSNGSLPSAISYLVAELRNVSGYQKNVKFLSLTTKTSQSDLNLHFWNYTPISQILKFSGSHHVHRTALLFFWLYDFFAHLILAFRISLLFLYINTY